MEFPKEEDFSEWYHKVLDEAQVIDQRYPIKGMLVYRKWGLYIIRQAQQYLERRLEEDGHEPVLFPVLIPEDVLGKESEHIAGFENEVFWVTHAGATPLERKLALRPTSETSMYNLFSLWVRTHGDLPIKIHQSCAVYRYDTKHTRPLIRGREFLWNEGHTAFATRKEALENIETIIGIYGKLIGDLLCLPYQVNKRPDWDKFPGAEYTIAFETLMPDGKTLQIATVHNLGQHFSKVFDITYADEQGGRHHAWQTSYGPGFGRLLAAVISVHGDEKGMILPPQVAPVQAVIVPIIFKDTEGKVRKEAEALKHKLEKHGIRVEIDDREIRPGEKYYYWEQRGVPLRIEIGPRDLEKKQVVVVRRDTGEKLFVPEADLDVHKIFSDIEANLKKKAQESFNHRIKKAANMQELEERLTTGGIIEAGWCGKQECAKQIEPIGTILTIEEDKKTDCVNCGNPGTHIRIAKTY
ncbi:Proline--tRNA ligase [uncultured archaeon]|nr:Proline--tRNA ligase [uncultured archaeon]